MEKKFTLWMDMEILQSAQDSSSLGFITNKRLPYPMNN